MADEPAAGGRTLVFSPEVLAALIGMANGLGKLAAHHHAAIGALATLDLPKARDHVEDANAALEEAVRRIGALAGQLEGVLRAAADLPEAK